MFDFAWTEIALIGVVALVLIGPKDLPIAVKAVSDVVKKMRRMAGEFQSHVDEMVKDTSLAEVRQQINEIRNMDIRGEIEKAVDSDGSIRSAFAEDPFRQLSTHADTPATEVPAGEPHSIAAPDGADAPHASATPASEAPAFVPPDLTSAMADAEPAGPPSPPEPPAFIPPGTPLPGAPRA